jgi:serine O-acetyltransferase
VDSLEKLGLLRQRLQKLWLLSPERLWLLSIALHRRGHWIVAFAIKQLNTILYHNSLAPGASVGRDIDLGHYSHGIVVNRNVEIGQHVKIWHNVTITAGRPTHREGTRPIGEKARVVIEDRASIGTNAVIIAPRGECLRIGRGARIGAGVVVTRDVPPGATVVGPAPRVLLRDGSEGDRDDAGPDVASAMVDDASQAPAGPTMAYGKGSSGVVDADTTPGRSQP